MHFAESSNINGNKTKSSATAEIARVGDHYAVQGNFTVTDVGTYQSKAHIRLPMHH